MRKHILPSLLGFAALCAACSSQNPQLPSSAPLAHQTSDRAVSTKTSASDGTVTSKRARPHTSDINVYDVPTPYPATNYEWKGATFAKHQGDNGIWFTNSDYAHPQIDVYDLGTSTFTVYEPNAHDNGLPYQITGYNYNDEVFAGMEPGPSPSPSPAEIYGWLATDTPPTREIVSMPLVGDGSIVAANGHIFTHEIDNGGFSEYTEGGTKKSYSASVICTYQTLAFAVVNGDDTLLCGYHGGNRVDTYDLSSGTASSWSLPASQQPLQVAAGGDAYEWVLSQKTGASPDTVITQYDNTGSQVAAYSGFGQSGFGAITDGANVWAAMDQGPYNVVSLIVYFKYCDNDGQYWVAQEIDYTGGSGGLSLMPGGITTSPIDGSAWFVDNSGPYLVNVPAPIVGCDGPAKPRPKRLHAILRRHRGLAVRMASLSDLHP